MQKQLQVKKELCRVLDNVQCTVNVQGPESVLLCPAQLKS